MKKYAIEVIETLSRLVFIEADSEEDAISQVWDMYSEEEIVLDSSDCGITEIKAVGAVK